MARTSNRRWKGCPICKWHKFAGHGDAKRTPTAALRQLGRTKRYNRHDIYEEDQN